MCLFPSTAFTRIVYEGLIGINNPIVFSINSSLMMLCVDTVLYFTLYVYLDQVLPNEYGTHKHPCFLFKGLFRRKHG
jgi:ATP-binding cassette subfamily A (ABC1) protein 3